MLQLGFDIFFRKIPRNHHVICQVLSHTNTTLQDFFVGLPVNQSTFCQKSEIKKKLKIKTQTNEQNCASPA